MVFVKFHNLLCGRLVMFYTVVISACRINFKCKGKLGPNFFNGDQMRKFVISQYMSMSLSKLSQQQLTLLLHQLRWLSFAKTCLVLLTGPLFILRRGLSGSMANGHIFRSLGFTLGPSFRHSTQPLLLHLSARPYSRHSKQTLTLTWLRKNTCILPLCK